MTSQSGIPVILPNYDEPSKEPAKGSLPWNTMFGALGLSIPICSLLYSVLINAIWLFSAAANSGWDSFMSALAWDFIGMFLILLAVVGCFAVALGIPIVIGIEAAIRRVESRGLHAAAHFGATAVVAGALVSFGIIPGFVIFAGSWATTPNIWQKIGIVALFAAITGAGAALSWLSADAIARRRAARAIPAV